MFRRFVKSVKKSGVLRRRLFAGLTVAAVILVSVMIGVSIKRTSEPDVSQAIQFSSAEENKDIGEIKSLEKRTKKYTYCLYYPETQYKSFNKRIKKQTDVIADDFLSAYGKLKSEKKESGILRGDYEIYKYDVYCSLLRNVVYEIPGHDEIRKTYAMLYSVDRKKECCLKDVFESSFYDYFSKYAADYLMDTYQIPEKEAANLVKAFSKKFRNFSMVKGAFIFSLNTDNSSYIIPLKIADAAEYFVEGFAVKSADAAAADEQTTDSGNGRQVDKTKPVVALTFDDGPNSSTTNLILDVLEKYNARATFFVIGSNVQNNSSCIKRAFDLGCEIGSHTYNHSDLRTLSSEQMQENLDKTNQAVKQITGHDIQLVRPPYGNTNIDVRQRINHPLIMWQIDTKDWKTMNPDSTESAVMNHVSDGSIILMHDIYGSTAQAVERIVPQLIDQGYQLVTVSEMMEAKDIELVNGYRYFSTTDIHTIEEN